MPLTIDQSKRVVGIGSNVVDVIYRTNKIAGPLEGLVEWQLVLDLLL